MKGRKIICMPLFVGLSLVLQTSCRGELPGVHGEEDIEVNPGDGSAGDEVTTPDSTAMMAGNIKGFFLLNEGNMGSNKCTLDFFDAVTGRYKRNIFPSRNPNVVKELGDVGNDLAIYGSKLYAVVNCSHLVEVMDVRTARHLAQIDITNTCVSVLNSYVLLNSVSRGYGFCLFICRTNTYFALKTTGEGC